MVNDVIQQYLEQASFHMTSDVTVHTKTQLPMQPISFLIHYIVLNTGAFVRTVLPRICMAINTQIRTLGTGSSALQNRVSNYACDLACNTVLPDAPDDFLVPIIFPRNPFLL